MLKLKYLIFFIILLSISQSQELESDNDRLLVIKTMDYSTYLGIINYQENDSLNISTIDGEKIGLAQSEVLVTYEFEGRIKSGRIQRKDPNASFYLFSPSAYAINSGNLYCRDFCLFYPSINYGFANIVSLQIGALWYPGMDYDNIPYVGNIKFTAFESDIVSIAGGVSYIYLPLIKDQELYSAGYGYATLTFGNRYNHASLSAGWGYVQEESDWYQLDRPIVVLAANFRILNSLSFMTENWIIPDKDIEDSLLSASIRFFGRQIALDVGVIFSVRSIQDNIEPVPVVNITYHLR
jgi:hypothetical protein